MKKNCLRLIGILFSLQLILPVMGLGQNSLHFDGTDDRVTLSALPISGTQNRTVEAWIKTSFNGTQRVIFDMGTMTVGTRFTLNVLNGLLRIEIGGGGINSTATVSDGQWHHVAATFDNGATNKYTLYIDGTVAATGNITQAINTAANQPCYVGIRNDFANPFIGNIDELRVWNYARTQAQIQASMNTSFCGPQTGLVLYYRFDLGTAGGNNAGLTSMPDASGNGHTGTLLNFALTGATSNWVAGTTIQPGVIQGGTLTATACQSFLSPSGNQTWTSTGTYPDTIPSAYGCDSVISVQLTILQPAISNLVTAACYSYTSPSGNYTWTTSGNYQDTLPNGAQNGCDSILNIDLTVNGSTSGSGNFTGCVPYTSPGGNQVWLAAGIYFDTLVNQNGCDSFLTAIFNIAPTPVGETFIDACDSYFWGDNGFLYTTPGTYTDSVLFTFPNGCDSLSVLHLNLTSTPTVSISLSGQSLTVTTNAATVEWVDCNNGFAVIPGTTNQPTFTPSQSGSYACIAMAGSGCADTSACETVTVVGLSAGLLQGIKAYPSPGNGLIILDLGALTATNWDIRVLDPLGRELHTFSGEMEGKATLDLTRLENGQYFIQARSPLGSMMERVIIQH